LTRPRECATVHSNGGTDAEPRGSCPQDPTTGQRGANPPVGRRTSSLRAPRAG
jgi:hypothetical protein